MLTNERHYSGVTVHDNILQQTLVQITLAHPTYLSENCIYLDAHDWFLDYLKTILQL